MSKPGKEYQQIVAAVEQVFNPGASVSVDVLDKGPDGRLDHDVLIVGTRDERPWRAHIECKDWKVPVGREVVDALDSKRQDCDVDLAIIYSNSGFTKDALSKAGRKGILTMSALRMDDGRIHVIRDEERIAKRHGIKHYEFALQVASEAAAPPQAGWTLGDVTYEGLSVQNWISAVSEELFIRYKNSSLVIAEYVFSNKTEFDVCGVPVTVTGIRLVIQIERKCVSKAVKIDCSLGAIDQRLHQLRLPKGETFYVANFGDEGWAECDMSPDEWDELVSVGQPTEPKLASIPVCVTISSRIPPLNDDGVPPIDTIICTTSIRHS